MDGSGDPQATWTLIPFGAGQQQRYPVDLLRRHTRLVLMPDQVGAYLYNRDLGFVLSTSGLFWGFESVRVFCVLDLYATH